MDPHPVAGPRDFEAIARHFPLGGSFAHASPVGNGHINDSFAITWTEGGKRTRYLLQRINQKVFPDVPGLMANIERVTAHLRTVTSDPRRRLALIPTRSGEPFHRDPDGECWRLYDFIEGARTFDRIDRPSQAREAAFAFGAFQRELSNLGPPRLHDTIPRFHDTRSRFEAFRSAVAGDAAGRAKTVRSEIDFAFSREATSDVLLDLHRSGQIPERIVHNDTKINNVMLDEATGKGLCVIDLDTVMPGLAPYDFGDMLRTGINTAAEDEPDLSRVGVNLALFEAFAEGYLAAVKGTLNAAEIGNLAFSGRVLAFEQGIRFLADHLNGDTYYKIHRPGHNLDRARCQFAFLRSLEEHFDSMRRVIERS